MTKEENERKKEEAIKVTNEEQVIFDFVTRKMRLRKVGFQLHLETIKDCIDESYERKNN